MSPQVGGPRGAEHGVRGVSTDLQCCPDGWQGPKRAPLLAARQHPGRSPHQTVLPAGLTPPVFSQPFFSIPIEASGVSVPLKSERNLMMKLNIIQLPFESFKLDPILPRKHLTRAPCSEPGRAPRFTRGETAEGVTGPSSARGCAGEGSELCSPWLCLLFLGQLSSQALPSAQLFQHVIKPALAPALTGTPTGSSHCTAPVLETKTAGR